MSATKFSQDVILEELVGTKQCIRGSLYHDAYMNKLNEVYSLKELLEGEKIGIAKGAITALTHSAMGTSLQNREGELVLNAILRESAKAGIWQPYRIDVELLPDTKIKTAAEYLRRVNAIRPDYDKRTSEDVGMIFGIAVAERNNFVKALDFKDEVIVLPTQEFVEYCQPKKRLV